MLIVDEAHRLKSPGTYMYRGDKGQVWDTIHSSYVSVFFVDDDQMIRKDDQGSFKKITEVAKELKADHINVELQTQFRCSGAEGYINWIENVLELKKTNIDHTWHNSYEFELFDDPNLLYDKIEKLNEEGSNARMLAGFAWDWYDPSKPNSAVGKEDVVMEEYGFRHSWNDKRRSTKWAVDDSMQNQIGCIHSSQGLEFDYVGVIIGNDMRYDPLMKKIYVDYNEYKDTAGKKGLKDKPEELARFIKNIYRVLLTRGSKGCFVFCRDKFLRDYMKRCFVECRLIH